MSSTNVAAGEASKASIDWLVTPTASSAAAAEISGAGWRWATQYRVPEPDAAVEDRPERLKDGFQRRPSRPGTGSRLATASASSVGVPSDRAGPAVARRLATTRP